MRGFASPLGLVWGVLMALTLFSLGFAESTLGQKVTIMIIFAVAIAKANLILVYFMEVNHAASHWRVLYHLWVGVTGCLLILGHGLS